MTTELRGPELLKAAVNHILEHPETWDQRHWHCGTTHCIAGHCQIIGGRRQSDCADSDARELLGISYDDAGWLFSRHRTLPEIYLYARAFITGFDKETGYDRDGYDRAGYNRDGYDRDGYDRDGHDRDGHDRDGYNRAGYNRAGYDRDGYNRAGYDRAGYDRDGYNRDGYDRAGYDRDGYNRAGYDRAGYNRAGYDRAGYNRDGYDRAGVKLEMVPL